MGWLRPLVLIAARHTARDEGDDTSRQKERADYLQRVENEERSRPYARADYTGI